jgi:hypothetical protein
MSTTRLMPGICASLLLTLQLQAEIRFVCHAREATQECAFSVLHPDGKGVTNFVLRPNEVFGVNDNFAGGSYCVVVSKPPAQVKDWPPYCHNAIEPNGYAWKNGPLKVGKTYE